MGTVDRLLSALGSTLAGRHWGWLLPVLCCALYAPTLGSGFIGDDHWHRSSQSPDPELAAIQRAPTRVFNFIEGRPDETAAFIREGVLPWWSHPGLRLSFYRPVAALTHALDYRLWPGSAWVMHAQSLLWYLMLVAAAVIFYRRFLPRAAVAGAAALLFAVDDGMTLPVTWIANRNVLLGLLFGLTTLVCYHRWRADGWSPGRWLAPAALAVAVLCNEGAVVIGAYLVGYALFLDREPWRRRLHALLPCTLVGLAWATMYRAGGFGAAGSGIYVDPASPLFLGAMLERIPVLLLGQWAWPPADLWSLLSTEGRGGVWLTGVVLIPLLGMALWPLLRRDPAARFLATGMLAGLLPAASTFPSGRLVLFGGIGAAGLLALLILHWGTVARDVHHRGRLLRWSAGVGATVLVLIHVGFSLLLIYPTRDGMVQFEGVVQRTAASVPRHAGVEGQSLIVVSGISSFVSGLATVVGAEAGPPRPRATHLLSSAVHGAAVRRPDAHTLVIRPRGGFLYPSHAVPEGTAGRAVDLRRPYQMLDLMFRDVKALPFSEGDVVDAGDITARVLSAQDGRPLEVAFHFAEPLDSERLLWMEWRGGAYVPFTLPAVGGEVTVAPLRLPQAALPGA